MCSHLYLYLYFWAICPWDFFQLSFKSIWLRLLRFYRIVLLYFLILNIYLKPQKFHQWMVFKSNFFNIKPFCKYYLRLFLLIGTLIYKCCVSQLNNNYFHCIMFMYTLNTTKLNTFIFCLVSLLKCTIFQVASDNMYLYVYNMYLLYF